MTPRPQHAAPSLPYVRPVRERGLSRDKAKMRRAASLIQDDHIGSLSTFVSTPNVSADERRAGARSGRSVCSIGWLAGQGPRRPPSQTKKPPILVSEASCPLRDKVVDFSHICLHLTSVRLTQGAIEGQLVIKARISTKSWNNWS